MIRKYVSDTRSKVMEFLTIFLGFILQQEIDITVEKAHYHRKHITIEKYISINM